MPDDLPTETDAPNHATSVQVPMESAEANGLHANIPAEEYHAIDRCSNSRLSLLKRSPAHAKQAIDEGPTPSTKSQRIGTATHTAVLEPELAVEAFDVAEQCSATTNSGSQCSYSGKVRRSGDWYCGTHDPGEEEAGPAYDGLVVSEDQHESICRMRDSVHTHPAASELLACGGRPELTALFDHADVDTATGEVRSKLACKARIDYVHPGGNALVDLKTTRDASKEAFQRDVWNRGYFRQLAFYRYALATLGRCDLARAYIVAVEKKAPFAVAVYELTKTTLRAGWRQLEDLLATYAQCERTGNWPGYSREAQELELPHWAWDKL
jgi:hypothetical protein